MLSSAGIALATAAALCATLAGCHTSDPVRYVPPAEGVHRHTGASFVQAKGYYGIPILQKSFVWDGNGETDDVGLGVHVARYFDDDVAVGVGLNVGTWLTPGADVYSGELEGLLRFFPFAHAPVFVDLTGGFQQATQNVPPGGTDWNFTFSFGPGIDLPIDRGCSLELGTSYHHISNALGRMNDRNPSQNEARLWIGFAWTL